MVAFEIEVLTNQALAILWNLWSWVLTFLPEVIRPRPPHVEDGEPCCVQINGPGGLDRLQVTPLKGKATVGYNVPFHPPPFTQPLSKLEVPRDCVLVENECFSVNYADITIRWGLYESALRYVGWPIVPGFDIAGTVREAGAESGFKKGDRVFGCTLFGAYSSLVLVPGRQLKLRPRNISAAQAAAMPAVSGTALHALSLAGFWPSPNPTIGETRSNKAVLIHSAAGGVGSMLVQMAKVCGCSPVVAVVGAPHKVQVCQDLGADVVIDKSNLSKEALWKAIVSAAGSGHGYTAVFDANGVSTLNESYKSLAMTGRLVIYGFHSNLPKGAHILSPFRWLAMIRDIVRMPSFDPMQLVLDSKSVLGFNLSFFAHEHKMIDAYLEQISTWIDGRTIAVPPIQEYSIRDIADAHRAIQSGKTVGKLVIRTNRHEESTPRSNANEQKKVN